MKIKHFLMVAYCIIIVNTQAHSQGITKQLNYKVSSLGMNIGDFKVKQTTYDNGTIEVEAITNIKMKLLLTYKIEYVLKTIHKDGLLVKSHLQTKKNGKINSDTWLIAENKKYKLIKDGDTTVIDDSISLTGSLLYFKEPLEYNFIYKEKSGEKKTIKSIDDHSYALVNNKGQVSHEYTFKGGKVTNARIKHSISDIYLEQSK